MMRPRLMAAALATVVVGAGAAACGGTSSSGSGGGKTVNAILENHPWTRAITPFLPEFEKQTGIKVNVQTYSEEQSRNKILVSLQSHSPDLDVFMSLPSNEGEQYYQAGYYQPLDSYVQNSKLTPSSYKFDDFNKGPINGERIGGKLIGIPILVEGPVIFYRTDLFAQYGITVPKTIDELLADAKTIKDKSGGKVYPIAGRGLAPSVSYTFGTFFHDQGLQWADDSGKPNFDKPGATKAIDEYATLVGKYGPPGVVNNSFTQSSALFAQGKVAMELDSSNEISSITNPTNSQVVGKIGVFQIPAGPGGSHPTVLQWGISMSKYAKNKDAAWKFIQWATSPEMQLKLAMKGIQSPRASTASDPQYQATLKTPLQKAWQATLNNITATGNPEVGPPAVKESQVRKIMGDEIDKVMLGQEDAAAAAAQIQKALTPLLGKSGQ